MGRLVTEVCGKCLCFYVQTPDNISTLHTVLFLSCSGNGESCSHHSLGNTYYPYASFNPFMPGDLLNKDLSGPLILLKINNKFTKYLE